jgi:hypothetical protein
VRQADDAGYGGEQAPVVRQDGDGAGCGGEEVGGRGMATDGRRGRNGIFRSETRAVGQRVRALIRFS